MTTGDRLRVLIVDDEPHARSGVRGLLERDEEIAVVAECENGEEAVEAIEGLSPDIVLLDVQMPGMNGFEVISRVGPERMPMVVFVTAYDRFALDAFDVDAVDYLLKPFDDERFTLALDRAKAACRSADVGDLAKQLVGLLRQTSAPDASIEPARYPARLAVKKSGRVLFVRVGEIDWIEAADYYARLHVGGKDFLIRETLSSLESRLDPEVFFRAHRSAIVNLDSVREIQPYFHGSQMIILRDGTEVRLSRARRERLESLLRQKI